jgi:hypothetical protein
MKYLALVCCLGILVAACGDDPERGSSVPQPSPIVPSAPEPPPAHTDARQIAVGEEVKDTIISEDRHYVVTAPSEGMIAVRLAWQNGSGAGAVLTLKVNGAEVRGGCAAIDSSAIVGASRSVRLTVGRMGDGCWNYGDELFQASVKFVLTTSME